jgi:hypothetical protein
MTTQPRNRCPACLGRGRSRCVVCRGVPIPEGVSIERIVRGLVQVDRAGVAHERARECAEPLFVSPLEQRAA